MKRSLLMVLGFVLMLALFGCGSGQASNEPLSLVGNWKQSNSSAEDNWQEITITEDSIEVVLIENNERGSLYWAGTYVPPTTATDSYSWESEIDKSKESAHQLVTSDDTLVFTYEKGELSFQVTLGQISFTNTFKRA